MATRIIPGARTCSLSFDSEGYRTYRYIQRVVSDGELTGGLPDGPGTALLTPDLPTIGSLYIGYEAIDDPWCWCMPDPSATPVKNEGGNSAWDCEFHFSNKPLPRGKSRCQDFRIEDPLLEPQKISGSFVKSREEAAFDRFGNRLLTSSHEQIRGPQVEKDVVMPSVKIEQNVIDLQLDLLAAMANTLNDAPLWGLPARCIRLIPGNWDQQFYQVCESYYKRPLEFEVLVKINPATGLIMSGFDREILDEGTKVLRGHYNEVTGEWILDDIAGSPPNPFDPTHFIRYQDKNGNTARVILDGAGKPYVPARGTITNECDQCPEDEGGAPSQLELTGFTGLAPGPVILNIQAGCHWTGLGDDSETFYDLSFDGDSESGEGTWILSRSTGGTWTLDVPDQTWNCWGQNTLERNSGDGPAFVFVSPRAASRPGNRHVEFYNESNFLLLGVPLVLGLPTPP